MLIPVLLFIVGLLCLIKGGDWFVDGATGIARRFHVPELLIGATVVSIGTTLPEVMVSTTSALTGHGEIAYGNAIGSVICNSALIAAIPIVAKPGKVDPKSLRTPVLFFFVAAAFYAGVAYTTGSFTRPVGIILLAMFVAYIVCNVMAMKNAPVPEEEEEPEENASFAKELGLLAVGAVLIAVGADLLVDNGTLIAQALGVPESVIALTFVALGTSLPELVTAITSLAKGHGALSLGNVIGANVFNLVLVSGVSVALAPFTIPQNSTIAGMNASLVMDIPVMFAVMLLLTVPRSEPVSGTLAAVRRDRTTPNMSRNGGCFTASQRPWAVRRLHPAPRCRGFVRRAGMSPRAPRSNRCSPAPNTMPPCSVAPGCGIRRRGVILLKPKAI